MITSIVAAIAISQREARRKKAEQEAELAEAAKKSVLVVGATLVGLITALLLRSYGFTVIIVDERGRDDLGDCEEEAKVLGEIVTLAPTAVRLLEAVEGVGGKLKYEGRPKGIDYRRSKSSKRLAHVELSDTLVFAPEVLYNIIASCTTARVRENTKIVSYHDSPEDLDGPLPAGRPYALSSSGDKFYADLIVICSDGGTGRSHIFASTGENPANLPKLLATDWEVFTGYVDLDNIEDVEGAGRLLGHDGSGEKSEVWVSDVSYLRSLKTTDEILFELYHLSAACASHPCDLATASWHASFREVIGKASVTDHRSCAYLPPLASSVSRKSRKLLLLGPSAFTLPPHSPHLSLTLFIESAATLAACLKKAASVPLGLEVYTRLRALRFEEALGMARERLDTVTKSAVDEELEAEEVKWDVDGEWWGYDAAKEAEQKFEGVIEELTRELLGRQRAALEAQAREKMRIEEEMKRRQAEAEAEARVEQAKREEEEGSDVGYEDEDGDEDEDEGERLSQDKEFMGKCGSGEGTGGQETL